MFTPSEIQEKQFKSGLGYDKKEVELFQQDIASDYTILLMENDDLKKKLKDSLDSLSYYKSIEKTLQKALVLAEKTAQDTRTTAQKEAEVIEKEAKAKAQQILIEAQKQLELYEHRMMNLVHQYDLFRIQFQGLLKAQQELLDSKSFSVNTDGFTYQAESNGTYTNMPEKTEKSEMNPKEGSGEYLGDIGSLEDLGIQEDENQLKFDFIQEELGPVSYQTEDGFEFITIND